jgi:hypothetical protein
MTLLLLPAQMCAVIPNYTFFHLDLMHVRARAQAALRR